MATINKRTYTMMGCKLNTLEISMEVPQETKIRTTA
jgi:hypothetical protein